LRSAFFRQPDHLVSSGNFGRLVELVVLQGKAHGLAENQHVGQQRVIDETRSRGIHAREAGRKCGPVDRRHCDSRRRHRLRSGLRISRKPEKQHQRQSAHPSAHYPTPPIVPADPRD
jgi:hypothetical protein